jgi:acyl-coenzyme A thioesterase PaaI-like protein
MKTLTPKTGNFCFGCGADNSLGLKLTFHGDVDSGKAWTNFDPKPFMAGGINMMHGGFIALLLDEVSSKVLSMLDKRGVTRNLDVSYEKPVSLSNRMRLEAELVHHDGRKHFIEAQILNLDGEILAKSSALFLVFS